MAIQTNFPAVKPTLLLDFANTKKLDPRITFTRTTTATYYDGVTTAMAEQNLLLYSQEFDNAYWDKISASVSANAVVAPDGTSTAETITFTGAGSNARIVSVNSVISGATYTYSVFLKGTAGQTVSIEFDTTPGTTVTLTSTWARYSVTNAATAGTVNSRIISRTGNTATVFDAWGAQLEQRSSVTAYTATTTQPITNYIPVLLTAASGVARFDHNPTTDESLGLLVEEQRTNLLTYSADFSNAAWTKSGSNITANTIVAPDGALTGDKLVEDTATSVHRCYQTVSGTTNTNSYTGSFYAKKSERTKISYAVVEGATFQRQVYCMFDLDAGTAGSVNVLNGATGSASITSVGNGWYRCVITATLGGTDTAIFNNLRLVTGTDTINYTGNGYAGVYIWGAQLEAGAFPTSYIPTVAAQVTRNADVASMTGTNFSSWFSSAEGTFYGEAAVSFVTTNFPTLCVAYQVSSSNAIYLNSRGGASPNGRFEVNFAGVPQAVINNSTISSNTTFRSAGAYKFNDFALSTNAASVGTDTSGSLPAPTSLTIGSDIGNGQFANGTIKKLAYYPLRITNANLQALTS